MKRSRVLFVHPDANPGKLAALEAVHAEYRRYLQTCVDWMTKARAFSVPLKDLVHFFPAEAVLSTNVVIACQRHATHIVGSWGSSAYSRLVKPKISALFREGKIDEVLRKQLYTIGKYGISQPTRTIPREALDLYWETLLSLTKPPTISARIGMRTSIHTGNVGPSNEASKFNWWFGFSQLKKGRKVYVPLSANPFVKSKSDVTHGAMVRKDRRGRWCVSVLEAKDYDEPKEAPGAPRLGVDVGLNVLAATSDGRLYGSDVKPKFDRLYAKVRDLRANRQRQGLQENSPRLDRLEDRLSGLVKTATGTVANQLVQSYPGHVFVVEDLDLSGCRGQKRFAYRALHHSLSTKAPTIAVNPAYTSQECPACGYVSRKSRQGVKFQCRSCGKKIHADTVGSINLLRRSEDPQIGLNTSVSEVKAKLKARYRLRRSRASARPLDALPASSQRLTTGGPFQKGTGTASNAEELRA